MTTVRRYSKLDSFVYYVRTMPNTLRRRRCVARTTRRSRTENLRYKFGCYCSHPTRYGWGNTSARHVFIQGQGQTAGFPIRHHAEGGDEER